ncbi:MAG TPA: metallophosphoesterase, partial [Kiloniellaceae bacterium]|nr:metallophosphoesterase [Kiloniellaceae bacterium]
GRIVVKPQDDEGKTKISATSAGMEGSQIATREKENLRELRGLYGGDIELLEPLDAMATLDDVLAILSHEAYRQRNAQGLPGGLLTPPNAPTPIIVGDIHAQIDNLVTVLVQWGVLKGLSRGDAYLLFLGDFVHREGSGELEEMGSSLLALDLLFKLKVAFPENVFFLRGNHENFGGEVGKGGVPQGKLLWSRARELRGKKYARRLAQCFDQLAYVAMTSDYVACHGGPPRQRVSPRKLVNIEEYPELARDLVWNRLRRTGWPDGYSKRDVKLLREGIGAGKETPFIVSHTPLSRDDSAWLDAGGIPGHHIIFSANPKIPAVMLRGERGMVPIQLRCNAKSQ